jgi:two-component system heavy metal sensor histidine kinase CusS
MRRLSIRWKLTLWYGAVLAFVLVIFSTTVFLVQRHQLLERIDNGLDEEVDVLDEIERATSLDDLGLWLKRRFYQHVGFDYQITRPNGSRFFVNERMLRKRLPIPESVSKQRSYVFFESDTDESGGRWRVVAVQAPGPDGPLIVQVARSLGAYEREVAELLSTFLLTGPLTLLAAVSGGYFLAKRALRPVQHITQTANQITADHLDRRIEAPNPDDELGTLAQTLNRMIERLQASFEQMRRFTADVAHELRTPLAVMRTEAEVALRAKRKPEEYEHALGNLLEETTQLSEMADRLLFLCRQDAGLQPGKREPVRLDSLAKEVVTNMQLVADAKGVSLSITAAIDPVTAMVDRGQLRRVLYNLLDNATKYTEPGGQVSLRVSTADGRLKIEVQDTGIGISPEHTPHIFDRFYRADAARTGTNGAGLGLSICQSLVRSMGEPWE